MFEQTPPCPYCSGCNVMIYHAGTCPKIKTIEYHKDGTIKRVEFFEQVHQ